MALRGHGFLFKEIELFWSNLRHLFYNQKTLFDIFFLGLYFAEQVTLFILILRWPDKAHIFSGLFAILVITTISFEKLCMESRYRMYAENTKDLEIEIEKLGQSYNILANQYNSMVKILDERNRKTYKEKKT